VKLIELNPQFLQFREERVDPTQFVDGVLHPSGIRTTFPRVDDIHQAHGIRFLCPKCYGANGGAAGTHSVICWFEGRVPDHAQPGPGRWNPTGTGFEDLSFVPGKKSHSVLLIGGCAWHGFLKNGDVTI
jgi:hypothetical protein